MNNSVVDIIAILKWRDIKLTLENLKLKIIANDVTYKIVNIIREKRVILVKTSNNSYWRVSGEPKVPGSERACQDPTGIYLTIGSREDHYIRKIYKQLKFSCLYWPITTSNLIFNNNMVISANECHIMGIPHEIFLIILHFIDDIKYKTIISCKTIYYRFIGDYNKYFKDSDIICVSTKLYLGGNWRRLKKLIFIPTPNNKAVEHIISEYYHDYNFIKSIMKTKKISDLYKYILLQNIIKTMPKIVTKDIPVIGEYLEYIYPNGREWRNKFEELAVKMALCDDVDIIMTIAEVASKPKYGSISFARGLGMNLISSHINYLHNHAGL